MENNHTIKENPPQELKQTNKKQAFQVYSRLGFLLLLLTAAQIIPPAVLAPILEKFPNLDQQGINMLASYISMYLIALPLGLLLLKKFPNQKAEPVERKKINLKLILLLYPFGFAIMSVLNIAATLIQTHVIGKNASVTIDSINGENNWVWITFICGVIIAPIMEEFIFRYIPYKKAARFGAAPYIFWTAICFGLFHLNFGQSLYAIGLGVFLAIAMIKYKNPKNVIIVHVLINLTAGIGLGGIMLRSPIQILGTIYEIFSYAIIVIGLVCGIILFKSKMFSLSSEKSSEPKAKLRTALLNPGTLIYILVCLAVIVVSFYFVK